MIRVKSKDRWSFLEDIEAPMWVDLTLVANSDDQDMAEEWFCENHLFHQCSSRKLKSAVSHFSEENTISEFDLQGSFSPQLPPSVSRSRGKDYKGTKWKQDNSNPSVNQRHAEKVLCRKSSRTKQSSHDQAEPKLGLVTRKQPSNLKTSLASEMHSRGNSTWQSSKPVLTCQGSRIRVHTISASTKTSQVRQISGISFASKKQKEQEASNVSSQAASVLRISSKTQTNSTENGNWHSLKPTVTFEGPSNSTQNSSTSSKTGQMKQTSCISFENDQLQRHKACSVSGKPSGKSAGVSSVIGGGLRKGCVTRQASKMEVNGNMGKESGGEPSSWKSSVASSSQPPSDVNCLAFRSTENEEITPDSRHAIGMSQAVLNAKKISGVSTTTSNRRGKSNLVKPGCSEAVKSKPLQVNLRKTFSTERAKGILEVSQLNKSAYKGKENLGGRLAMSQIKGSLSRFQKEKTQDVAPKGDERVCLKWGNICRGEGKTLKNISRKIYLR